MQTLTVEITGKTALKKLNLLEEKQLIRIVDRVHIDSPALPGKVLGLRAFRNWVEDAEAKPTVDLKAAKQKWGIKRKQLQKSLL